MANNFKLDPSALRKLEKEAAARMRASGADRLRIEAGESESAAISRTEREMRAAGLQPNRQEIAKEIRKLKK